MSVADATERLIALAEDGKQVPDLRAENERLRSICTAIAAGLRGKHATREDMAKLADSGTH